MPKKPASRGAQKRSGAKSPSAGTKSTRLGSALVKGMTQVLAHVRGDLELKSYILSGPVDVRAIRKKTGMSQSQFASAFALNRRTLPEWEQGKSAPDNAVRAYLTVIDRNHQAVVEALRT